MRHAERAARVLVRAAALLTRPARRRRLVEEWDAELWHAAREGGASWSALLRTALGAFADARARSEDDDGGWTMREEIGMWVGEARLAARALGRSPGFTAVAVLTLAVGTGGSTAIYTLVDRVVLDPLPYPDAERLVRLKSLVPGVAPGEAWDLATGQYVLYGEEARTLDRIGAWQRGGGNLDTPEGPRRARVVWASASAFELLGAEAHLGRVIGVEDDRPGAPSVVVLSHAFWVDALGGDAQVVGRALSLDGEPFEVIGVMAPGVDLPQEPGASATVATDVWRALGIDPAGPHRTSHTIPMIARLAPGATVEAANAELERLTARLPEAFPNYSQAFLDRYGFRVVARPLKEHVVGDMARNLWILFGAVGLVLLIACANVANLFLVRLEGRRRELAIRSALGAGRRAVLRHLLAESLGLAATAGALGLALAMWAVPVLAAAAPDTLPRLNDVAPDAGAAAFAAALSLAVGLVLGGLPAARYAQAPDAEAMAEGRGSAGAGRDRQRLRGALVVGQVALALTLVVGAGLLLETLRRLHAVDTGIRPVGVVTMTVYPSPSRHPDAEALWTFARQVIERVEALPGVTAAGMTGTLPFGGGFGCTVQGFEDADIYERMREAGSTTCAGVSPTTPGYLEAMGVPVLRGRGLTDADLDDPRRGAVVVSRAFAERFWPGEDPIGKGVASARTEPPFHRVVGVVGDVPSSSVEEDPALAIYYPLVPIPGTGGYRIGGTSLSLVVHTARGDPSGVVGGVRAAVQAIDPSAPVAGVRLMEDRVAESLARRTFVALLLQVAAGTALLLAAVGLYGVISWVVSRRTREIGTRMALGARPGAVQRAVVGRSLALVGGGLVLGGALSAVLGGVMEGLLFGVEATHPATLGAAAGLLAAVALGASWLPARRAARVDPAVALRAD